MTDKERALLLLVARHTEIMLGEIGRTAGLSEAVREVENEQQQLAQRAWGKHD